MIGLFGLMHTILQLLPRVTRRLTDDELRCHLLRVLRGFRAEHKRTDILRCPTGAFASFGRARSLFGRRKKQGSGGGLTTSSGVVSFSTSPPPFAAFASLVPSAFAR